MKQIRANVFEVTHTELGHPVEKGTIKAPDGLPLHLNDADVRYIEVHSAAGYEPTFFVSRSEALGGDWIVVGRQHKA